MQIKIHPNPNEITIDTLKKLKLDELDAKCNATILSNFSAIVDGVTYYFSNDEHAQSNFKDAKIAWIDGDLQPTDTLKWTAYTTDGNVVRLQLTKEQFDPVNLARIRWQQSNVSKFRDILQPQVESASTEEQLNAIQW